MGNKNSTHPGVRSTDPTARSYSWQTDPAAAVYNRNVQQMPNGAPMTNGRYPAHVQHQQFFAKRAQSHQELNNGSVVCDNAAFGGVNPMGPHSPVDHPPPGHTANNAGSAKAGRPGTSDSGYFGMDSDPRRGSRQQLRGSRLSLNEAVFDNSPSSPQRAQGPPGPAGMPPIGPGGPMPPPFGPNGHPPPMFMDPRFSPPPPLVGPKGQIFHLPPHPFWPHPPPPDFDSKKLKKWRKKQIKMIKKGSYPGDMRLFPHPFPMGPPPLRQQQERGPNGMGVAQRGGPGARAQSMDNLMATESSAFPSVGAQFHPQHSSNSRSELGLNNSLPHQQAGTHRTVASDNNSSSKGSRRSRGIVNELTHFEEERPDISKEYKSHFLPHTNTAVSTGLRTNSEQRIYETLKLQNQTSNQIVATAEISGGKMFEAPPSDRKILAEVRPIQSVLPVKISAEAQAILDKNAKLYEDKAVEDNDHFWQNRILPRVGESPTKRLIEETESPEKPELQTVGSGVKETILEATLIPRLPERTRTKPNNFDPNEAWKSIGVEEFIRSRRNLHRNSKPDVQGDCILLLLL